MIEPTEVLHDDDVLHRTPETLWRRLLGGILLLAPEMSEPLRLSHPADLLWEALREPIRMDVLVALLADMHEVAPAAVHSDIEPVLRTLVEIRAVCREIG